MSTDSNIVIKHGLLTAIQEAVCARLRTVMTPLGVSVLRESVGNIEYEIEQGIGKIGVVVIVVTPQAVCKSPNAPGPMLDEIVVVVRVMENPVTNTSGVNASRLAELAARMLHHFVIGSSAVMFRQLGLQPDASGEGIIIYDARFVTSGVITSEA